MTLWAEWDLGESLYYTNLLVLFQATSHHHYKNAILANSQYIFVTILHQKSNLMISLS